MVDVNKWDARYRAGEHTNRDPHPLLARAIEDVPPGDALDLACGAGRHALLLAARGWSVTAVDASTVAIEILSARAAEAGVAVDSRTADLEGPEFTIEESAFDLICDFLYLQRDLFPRIRGGIRPGGLFAAAIPSQIPMNPAYRVASGELAGFFPGWEILHCAEGEMSELIARRPRR